MPTACGAGQAIRSASNAGFQANLLGPGNGSGAWRLTHIIDTQVAILDAEAGHAACHAASLPFTDMKVKTKYNNLGSCWIRRKTI